MIFVFCFLLPEVLLYTGNQVLEDWDYLVPGTPPRVDLPSRQNKIVKLEIFCRD
jgi:hypothetical protein